jgi:hypothetical protein
MIDEIEYEEWKKMPAPRYYRQDNATFVGDALTPLAKRAKKMDKQPSNDRLWSHHVKREFGTGIMGTAESRCATLRAKYSVAD